MGAFMRFERERKNGGRVKKKKGAAKKKDTPPLGLNSQHSKGCWVFIYTGRWQSSFMDMLTRLFNGYFEKPDCSCWSIHVFIAVWMYGRLVVTG